MTTAAPPNAANRALNAFLFFPPLFILISFPACEKKQITGPLLWVDRWRKKEKFAKRAQTSSPIRILGLDFHCKGFKLIIPVFGAVHKGNQR
ncbi:hypothetical protein DdX_16939 [Ditylenchus destructor]|uniref:Uncharacterized protein n=1 Tax=Ditylenchus destructor TaxID=166010 RepID=A0AAD4QZL3_9BILA|nr:hypothetical protein DdX_16939 [Ditylenchus destructor]